MLADVADWCGRHWGVGFVVTLRWPGAKETAGSRLIAPVKEDCAYWGGVMSHEVGIWIDHKKAVVVTISAGHVSTKTLMSDVGPHTRYSGSQEGGGEKKYRGAPHRAANVALQ